MSAAVLVCRVGDGTARSDLFDIEMPSYKVCCVFCICLSLFTKSGLRRVPLLSSCSDSLVLDRLPIGECLLRFFTSLWRRFVL